MPFIARKDNRTVIPADVDDGEDVYCTQCGDVMRVRGPFEDGRSRHFYHVNNVGGSCTGSGPDSEPGPAESETHQRLKALAVTGLRGRFDEYARCGPEITIDISSTSTEADQRRADVLLEFEDTNRFFGKGVIVEVQHLNAGKDIRATTHDYLSQDFSVYWATVDDFSDGRFLIEEMEAAFDERRDAAFALYRDAPPALDAPDRLITPDEEEDARYTTTDLVPECSHLLVPADEAYRVCVRCGVEIETCVYDDQRGRLRNTDTVPSYFEGERVLATDRRSVDYPVSIRPVEEEGESPDHTHIWGRSSGIFGGDKYRCTRCDSTLLVSPNRIQLTHETAEPWKPDEAPWE
ncbi:hypothetical protein JMJ58_21020 (plasmid) [Haloterrigena salifodinae]|uniref:Competence CoiA family protein n=1 Tax=Haloterrigena salifodinae TaxID=2675099 RepID=A0A8T8E7I5_9EURY|nr:hypothetical protein [Haloterrigena salifodinae]QRV17440.1 hypothetical protein JMJ58_21020 [Haloterrigena salifodinae]